VKGIYFKETDVLEAQWATFNDVSLTVNGGSSMVAEHLWYAVVAIYDWCCKSDFSDLKAR
jgi:hypothetical protein